MIKYQKDIDKFFFKSSFAEPLGQFQPKFGTKHSLVNGIQVCLNKGPQSFQRRDDNKIEIIHQRNLTISSSRITGQPISNSISCLKRVKFVKM